MRRFVGPGLGVLLGWVVVSAAPAQRAPDQPEFALEEARPNPIFPASLVPFVIAPEVCRKGHVPMVALRTFNVLSQSVATLHLHYRPTLALDSVPLRCGRYVGAWDGTVDGGTRAAAAGVYYLSLMVDGRSKAVKVVVTQP